MLGQVEVLGRVLILGVVAAADMPTDLAKPQVYPWIAYFQAIFTAIRTWCDHLYLVKMTTFHWAFPILFLALVRGPSVRALF